VVEAGRASGFNCKPARTWFVECYSLLRHVFRYYSKMTALSNNNNITIIIIITITFIIIYN
jgi:hypothetical protein